MTKALGFIFGSGLHAHLIKMAVHSPASQTNRPRYCAHITAGLTVQFRDLLALFLTMFDLVFSSCQAHPLLIPFGAP